MQPAIEPLVTKVIRGFFIIKRVVLVVLENKKVFEKSFQESLIEVIN